MQRISPREAHALMENEGYAYLDVRTPLEFAEGHPAGAYNVPWLEQGPSGWVENSCFVEQVAGVLARDAKIIVGCAAGVRSLAAAERLEASGYLHVLDQRAGMSGLRDPFGRARERGWRDEGLPVDSEPRPLRSHREIVARLANE
jgi:rhodanese-related sulfurtransferase